LIKNTRNLYVKWSYALCYIKHIHKNRQIKQSLYPILVLAQVARDNNSSEITHNTNFYGFSHPWVLLIELIAVKLQTFYSYTLSRTFFWEEMMHWGSKTTLRIY